MNKQKIINELHALSEDISLETALFQQKAAARAGLTVNDMRVLSVIMKNPDISASSLGRKLNLTNGALSGIVGRLAERKLILRTQSPNDSRKILLAANFKHIAAGDDIYQRIGRAYQEMIRGYSAAELALILNYSRKTLDLTKLQSAMIEVR